MAGPREFAYQRGGDLRRLGPRDTHDTDAAASRGQVVELDASSAGTLEGIRRFAYDGTALPIEPDELVTPEVTTRDIDRGSYQHFLLKEIEEAPGSFRKTLRGKIAARDGLLAASLGDDTLPSSVREELRSGRITRIKVIGQGTAAVAGQSLGRALAGELAATEVRVEALPATELSGFSQSEFETHVREEYSTFSWVLEGFLERAGLEILEREYPAPEYAEYLCRPQEGRRLTSR